MNKKNINLKIPTHDDFYAFRGAHCSTIYKSLPWEWKCPSCKRNRYEILRWSAKFNKWAAGYHMHHDHGSDPYYGNPKCARFGRKVICEQCNNADGAAKRKLKLPANFSFSPYEISQFITAVAHGYHTINYEIAKDVYENIEANNFN